MSTYIQTSNFAGAIPSALAEVIRAAVADGATFAFVASEFERDHERTDKYFNIFREKLEGCGITFGDAYTVDGRMTPAEAQAATARADVLWLSGGFTPGQWACFEKYGIVDAIRACPVVIGMSAGAINMAKTAVCTPGGELKELRIYPALGLVDTSVEPHFNVIGATPTLLEVSHSRPVYGLCDEAAVIHRGGETTFLGDVFLVENGVTVRISE